MAKTFHTPINVWLDMEIPKLFDWVMIADQMMEEEKQKLNVQNVGRGL